MCGKFHVGTHTIVWAVQESWAAKMKSITVRVDP